LPEKNSTLKATLTNKKMLMHLIGHFEKNNGKKATKVFLQFKASQFVSGFFAAGLLVANLLFDPYLP
jgi:hypothetical protein